MRTTVVASLPLLVIVLLAATVMALSDPSSVHGQERNLGRKTIARVKAFAQPVIRKAKELFAHLTGSAQGPSPYQKDIACGEWNELTTQVAPWHALIVKIEYGHVPTEEKKAHLLYKAIQNSLGYSDDIMHGTVIGSNLVLTNNHRLVPEDDVTAKKFTYNVYLGGIQPLELTQHTEYWEVAGYFVRPKSSKLHLTIKQIALVILKRAVDFQTYPTIRPVCLPKTEHPFVLHQVLRIPFQLFTGGDDFKQLSKIVYVDGKRTAPLTDVHKLLDRGIDIDRKLTYSELGLMDSAGPPGDYLRMPEIADGGAATHQHSTNKHVLVGIAGKFLLSTADSTGRITNQKGFYFLEITFEAVRAWIVEKAAGSHIYS